MKRRTQQFIAAFIITFTVIAALCGFMIVDLSTDRYMPTEYGPLFQVAGITSEGLDFYAMGESYRIDTEQVDTAKETVWRLRGLLPHSITVTGNLITRLYVAAQSYLSGSSQPEEPW